MQQTNFKIVYFLDALFFSLMTGAGEIYFSAYSLRLGHSELQAGILATVPLVIGGLLQVVAPYFIAKIKSYKIWATMCAIIQALLYLPLVFFQTPLTNHYELLFLIVTLYNIFSLAISPAWITWISKLIDKDKTALFFSIRNIIVSIFMLVGMISVGLLLQYGKSLNIDLRIFQYIFFSCFLFRMISAFLLFEHPSRTFTGGPKKLLDFVSFKISSFFLNGITNFTIIFKLGVFVSAGFFAPYMLKVLHLSYFEYMLIISSSFFGRIFFLQIFRKFFKDADYRFVYLLSAIGISMIPVLWTFSTNVKYLISLEFFTGVFWGGHELMFFLIVFKETSDTVKTSFMSYFNFFHTLAIGIGVGIGIILFNYFEAYGNAYIIIFYVSSLIRFLSFIIFPPKNKKISRS